MYTDCKENIGVEKTYGLTQLPISRYRTISCFSECGRRIGAVKKAAAFCKKATKRCSNSLLSES